MSFRTSRAHTKPTVPARRSTSLTRTPGSNSNAFQNSSTRPYSSGNYGNIGSGLGYTSSQNSYLSNPQSSYLSSPSSSSNYLSSSASQSSPLGYSSSQNNFLYGSNQNLRNGSNYYDSTGRRGSLNTTSNMKFPLTTMSTSSTNSYKSPYKDSRGYTPGSNYLLSNSASNSIGNSNGYTSAYKDRYYSPYSSYDNGITTAGLNISLNSSNVNKNKKRDYTPIRNSNLKSLNSSGLSSSTQTLNSYNNNNINDVVANLGRSQSLREQERKSRNRKRAAIANSSAEHTTTTPTLSTSNSQLDATSIENLDLLETLAAIESGSNTPDVCPIKASLLIPGNSPIRETGVIPKETFEIKEKVEKPTNKKLSKPEKIASRELIKNSTANDNVFPPELEKNQTSNTQKKHFVDLSIPEFLSQYIPEISRSFNRSLSTSSQHSEGYESGNDTRSRVDSISSAVSDLKIDNNDDGEFVDYKALYEAAKAENDKLKATLKVKEDDLQTTKAALEKLSANAAKNSLSEQEKREKRAMERKISEMEEELKQMDNLRTENQRLKDENGALIRVISKLSK